jgi:hypothetical protein
MTKPGLPASPSVEVPVKPLDPKVMWAWAAAWDKTDLRRTQALVAIKPLLPEPHCLVVLTHRVDGAPFRTVLHYRASSPPVVVYQAPSLDLSKIVAIEARFQEIALKPGFYNGVYIDSELLINEEGPISFAQALRRAQQAAHPRCRCPVIYAGDEPAESGSA